MLPQFYSGSGFAQVRHHNNKRQRNIRIADL